MFESLRSLSDHEIITRTRTLVSEERKLTLNVLLHLNEIDARELFLRRGFPSMFEYCTAELGYSASAASRRIRTARCIVRFPEVFRLLQANELNLSTVCQIAKILAPENSAALLEKVRGKSQREVETIVAEYDPLQSLPRERVRTVVVRVPLETNEKRREGAAAVGTPTALAVDAAPAVEHANEYDRNGRDGDARGTNVERHDASPGAARLERRAVIQFCAREAVMATLERVRSLAAHRLPANAPFEELVEFLADYFVDREDPSKRQQRREARKQTAEPAGLRDATSPCGIPARVRDEAFVRAGRRCTYVSPGGQRCTATHALQIDHINPVARGGTSTPDNLRVLCAKHNRFEAQRLMGAGARTRPNQRRL